MPNEVQPSLVDPAKEAWHRQYRRTPDLWYLQQHARQLVFIGDEFKAGKSKHDLLGGQEPFHPSAYTLDPYRVFLKDMGDRSFPLPFEKDVDFELYGWYESEVARFRGELYALPSQLIWKVLDIQKENGLQFTRKRVSITLPWREIRFNDDPNAETWSKIPTISKDHLRTVRAWMYVARPEYWDDYIGVSLGTRPVDLFQHNTPRVWIDRYYKF
jgi:hypothetical protein